MDRDSNKYIVHFLCVKLVSVGLGDQKLGGVGVLRLYVFCISILSRGFISVWSESGRVALRRGNVDERRTRVPEVSGSSLSNATYWIWSTVIRVTNPQPRPVHGQLGFLTVQSFLHLPFRVQVRVARSRLNELFRAPKCNFVNPFTPESDQCQNIPAASHEIWHHTVQRIWLFIAYSDEKWLYYKFLLHHSYNCFLKGWENTLFELRSERVKWKYFTFIYARALSSREEVVLRDPRRLGSFDRRGGEAEWAR